MTTLADMFSGTPEAARVLAVGAGDFAFPSLAAVDRMAEPEELGSTTGRDYDVAVVGDVLFRLQASAVERLMASIHSLLLPGGACLVETRTYLEQDGAGLGDRLRTPFAHLAFARDAIDEYYELNGWELPLFGNFMCRATYLVLFRRVGFAIEEALCVDQEASVFPDKLRWYEPSELRSGVLRARLRRPADEEDERRQLRAARKSS